jgi:hypothetical protein
VRQAAGSTLLIVNGEPVSTPAETAWLTPAAAVRQAVAAADAVLLPAGFVRRGRGRAWRRETSQLRHVVELHKRADSYSVQWSTVSPEAVPVLWAETVDPTGVAAGLITGTPMNVDDQARGGSFTFGTRVTPERAATVSALLAAALEPVVGILAPLETRADLRGLLLASTAEKSGRIFALPASRSLQLLFAAVLAVLDASPHSTELIVQAEAAGLPSDDERLRRLHQLVAQT